MRRFIALALAAVFVATACTAVAPSASPTKTPDIKRSKLDAAYSGLTDDDVFAPTSKEVLTAALQAMKDEVQKAYKDALTTEDRQALLAESATRRRLALESRLLRRELTLLRALGAVPVPLRQFATPMTAN